MPKNVCFEGLKWKFGKFIDRHYSIRTRGIQIKNTTSLPKRWCFSIRRVIERRDLFYIDHFGAKYNGQNDQYSQVRR